MGQGGYITIVNATLYDMASTYNNSYQMNVWKFPDIIATGTTEKIYVDWSEGKRTSELWAEHYYAMNGNKLFSVEARNRDGKNICIRLKTFGTKTCPQGSLIDLGWKNDGNVTFILSGNINSLSSNGNTVGWVDNNQDWLYTRKLREICILSAENSHDFAKLQGILAPNRRGV